MGMTAELNAEFGALYRRTYPQMLRTAVGFLGDPDRAEEVVHDAFLKAYQGYGEFRGEAAFETWMYRIVVNACRDVWRRRKKLPIDHFTQDLGLRLEDIVDTDRENDPETVLLSRAAQSKCLHCLTECLPTGQRQVFCLTVTLDLPHRRAAEILGITEAAVKASLHRAMKRWKGYMENRCEFIRQDNPCRCRQWIRHGQQAGWIKATDPPVPEVNMVFRQDIIRLKDLRTVYQQLYLERADDHLARRIAEGIAADEWSLFRP